ncbi:hypothetical protein TPHA_0J01710 [Tetrapisispora phaffii CBS 4417]|uniref:Sas10 C-terminal domain-containing protein n=1 Tax=Tetrapisispora phaffii (strain ATCC 24235 / CBS 4417 / NBRC 1672 / NRRL Y-8282 / UCD 70-5) TaxID=1071381 RepID=G8BYQ0_TETPH|nr:hypothetical protein TPHA_0J01710 [Tetrapisispora phaffii CBS 4417]CCE64992.1 hypothetical protein TPHA_0J01710 [Tetrapisispora phaffii CBS 4417]
MPTRRARSNKTSGPAAVEANEYGLNEVDDFADKREKVMFSESTLADRADSDNDEDLDILEEEEEVMSVSGESDDEEEILDGPDAYRKVFGRNLDLGKGSDEEGDADLVDDENAWGSTKNEYYGADDLDDIETAKEIEKEALRQQKKHLEDLNMNDYLDDAIEEDWSADAKKFDLGEFKNVTNQDSTVKEGVTINDLINMDKDSKKDYLKVMFPEFLPLTKELLQLSPVLKTLQTKEHTEFLKLKVIALSSYLGTISSYMSVLLHELNNNEDFVNMKDHPVMEAILTSKEIWRQASELPDDLEKQYGDSDSELETNYDKVTKTISGDDDNDEIGNEEGEEQISNDDEDDEEEEEEDNEEDVDIDDFEEYVTQSRILKKKDSKSKSVKDTDDFVESELADVDAQEKQARKKTLRFYTSKIDNNENKKFDKFTGDDDIPYRERLFERQQRLIEEARKRGLHDKNGAALDGKDYDSEDEATSKSINKSGEKEYYNQIQATRLDKKNSRIQAHKAAVKASREGKLAELAESIDKDGKRAVNYQIMKNKGLTPKRNKDNRNSRVKKRKKYEKAQKKLKSVRAVYSGGLSGAYEGEKTGIKKNLTRSVKFKN